jgi:D-xylose transport system substrate-binding protein
MKRLGVVILTALLALLLAGPVFATGGDEADEEITIGVSFSDFATDRWPREDELMRSLVEEAGANYISQVANYDVTLQNNQIENMILQGADCIIVIAQDGASAAAAVEAAAADGIPVIAYDRLIKSDQLAAYVTFDNVEVGRAQARGVTEVVDSGRFVLLGGSPTDNNAILFRNGQMEILQPLIDSGQIEIVADQWVQDWAPANAVALMENILTAIDNDVDAVVASNDGTALGALQAMRAQGLAGTVPISGQDATESGCASIVAGELTMTVFKDVRLLTPLAVEMALQLARGESVPGLQDFTLAELTLDDSLEGTVPCRFLEVVQVDADNVYEEIILSGFQDYDAVYRDIPEEDRPPRP